MNRQTLDEQTRDVGELGRAISPPSRGADAAPSTRRGYQDDGRGM
jgi:hypothetical protein